MTGSAATSVRVIRELDASDDPTLRAWDLDIEAHAPMEQYIWARACALALGCEPRVVALGPHGDPIAVAPLARPRSRRPRAELLGVRELYEPTNFVYADARAAEALASSLVDLGWPLFLQRMPASSAAVAAIRAAYRAHGIVICRPAAGYAAIDLDSDWTEPEQKLSARRRADVRRTCRRAEQLGDVEPQILAPSPAELPRLLDEAFAVEAAGWKGRARTALAHDARRAAFYRTYAQAAAERGILRLCFLRIAGRPAAMQIAVETRRRFWLLRIGFDEAFARCSPGVLLMLETIRWAARRGLRSYELLGDVEPWTRPWTQLVRPCVSVRAYPGRTRGLAAFASDATAAATHRLRRALPRT